MPLRWLFFVVGLLLASHSVAVNESDYESSTNQRQRDEIHHLPGLEHNPGFQQYSGYLDVSKSRHLFYWYVESQGSPQNDPIVFWTNGGPGCSGLIGFGGEHGPFYISIDGKLTENPFSWNKFANMLYVEQPACVGFSYGDTPQDLTTGDQQAARDNLQLIIGFFDRFPERRSNAFFVASESYGGHYVPQLTFEILQHNENGGRRINFQGFLVGNPFVDPYTNMLSVIRTAYYHGLISKPVFDEWKHACEDAKDWMTAECSDIMDGIYDNSKGVADPYALDFPLCLEEGADNTASLLHPGIVQDGRRRMQQHSFSQQGAVLLKQTRLGLPPFLPPQDVYRPCAYHHTTMYLRREDVRRALHVREAARVWSSCADDTLDYSERDANANIVPLYRELVTKGVQGKHNLSMLVFSGDDDCVCGTSGTQSWIWDLGVNATTTSTEWKAWRVQNQTAGFVTQFDLGPQSDASFVFATVHGAGHEVPACRPMEALELFRRYLDKELF